MNTPFRAVVEAPGGPDAIRLVPFKVPALQPGQALLRHTAIGVNFIDTYHRSGLYPLPSLPHGLGMEAAGVVEQRTEGSTFREGQRVVCTSGPPGAYATHRVVDETRLIPLPNDISDEVAAAVTLKGMTAEYLLFRTYAVQPGDTVLLHGAAGGLGLLACQWLKQLGATVFGTVSSDEKAALAAANGCDFPIVYSRENFVERVRTQTQGRGVRVVYDGVGKATFAPSLDCLSPRGLYVGVGNASGKPELFDINQLAQKGSLFLTRPNLLDYTRTREELLRSAERVFEALRRGVLRLHIGQRFPLSQVSAAHTALEGRATTGSTVLTPDELTPDELYVLTPGEPYAGK
jgi:NADPH2:quinone reductase